MDTYLKHQKLGQDEPKQGSFADDKGYLQKLPE
jgi:hypothetical protein